MEMEKGFSLAEVLVYLSILTVVLLILIGSLIMMAQVQERVVAGKALERSAVISLDRFLREVRLSDSICRAGSVFDESESVLVLNNESVFGGIRFYTDNGSLYIEKEGLTHRLTHKNTEVREFIITEIESGGIESIRVEVVLEHPYSDGSVEQRFFTTAILRGSYENHKDF